MLRKRVDVCVGSQAACGLEVMNRQRGRLVIGRSGDSKYETESERRHITSLRMAWNAAWSAERHHSNRIASVVVRIAPAASSRRRPMS